MPPEVPTTPEVGPPGVLGASEQAVVAPAGTPREIVSRLYRTLVGTIAVPEMRNTLVAQGASPVGSSPEELRAFMREQEAHRDPVLPPSAHPHAPPPTLISPPYTT